MIKTKIKAMKKLLQCGLINVIGLLVKASESSTDFGQTHVFDIFIQKYLLQDSDGKTSHAIRNLRPFLVLLLKPLDV